MEQEYQKQGLTLKEYHRIHDWLRLGFVKPDRCEMCNKKRRLQNALIKGCRYEKKRENFIVLCSRCHNSYDRGVAKKQESAKRYCLIFNTRLGLFIVKKFPIGIKRWFEQPLRDKKTAFNLMLQYNDEIAA